MLTDVVLGFASGVIGGMVYVHLSDWILYRKMRQTQRRMRDVCQAGGDSEREGQG